MGRGAALGAIAIVVALGGAAWIAYHDHAPVHPTPAPAGTTGGGTVDAARHPVRAHAAVAADQVSAPADGGIRVVDATGSPVQATIYTTPSSAWSDHDAQPLGATASDGVLAPAGRAAPAPAFVWAFGRGLVAGPERFVAQGQVLTLGEGARVEVHVARPDGRPVRGARCWSVETPETIVTDAAGVTALAGLPRGADVVIHAAANDRGMAVVRTPAAGDPRAAEIVLDPGPGPFMLLAVRGGEEADARIEISGGGDAPEELTCRVGDTPHLVALETRTLGPVTLTARASGRRIATRTLDVLERGTTTDVVLTLALAGVPARGHVLATDGTPVAGAVVGIVGSVFDEEECETTEEDGEFRVRDEWLGRTIRAVLPRKACSDTVALVGAMDELTLRVGPAGTLYGTVRDEETGRPVADMPVRVLLNDKDIWDATTDSAGRYRVGGLPIGTVVEPMLRATPRTAFPSLDGPDCVLPDFPPVEELIRLGRAHRVESATPIRHDFVRHVNRGGVCTVRVTYPQGTAPPDALDVSCHWLEPGRDGERIWWSDTVEGAVEARVFLVRGTHRIHVTAPGLVGVSEPIHVAGDGELPDVVVAMEQLPVVRARVVDLDGHPLRRQGIKVTVGSGAAGHELSGVQAETDDSGIADLEALVRGVRALDSPEFSLMFTLRGRGIYSPRSNADEVNLCIAASEWVPRLREAMTEPWVIDVPLIMPPVETIRVVDAAGLPVAGVGVRWAHGTPDRDSPVAVSDAAGRISVPRLAPHENVSFAAQAPWFGEAKVALPSDAPGGPTITVHRPRTVRVRFVTTSGEPLAHRTVDCSGREMLTDGAGRVDAVLPECDTKLRASVAHHWTPPVAVPEGATEVAVVAEPLHSVRCRILLPSDRPRPEAVEIDFGNGWEPDGTSATIVDPPEGPMGCVVELPYRPMSVSLSLFDDPWYGGRARYDGATDDMTLRVVRLTPLTVVLAVVDDAGRPLADVPLTLDSGYHPLVEEHVVTDANGHVTVHVFPAELGIWVASKDHGSADWDFDPETVTSDPVTIRLVPEK